MTESEDHLEDWTIIHMRDKVAWTRVVAVGVVRSSFLVIFCSWIKQDLLIKWMEDVEERRVKDGNMVRSLGTVGRWSCHQQRSRLQERVDLGAQR